MKEKSIINEYGVSETIREYDSIEDMLQYWKEYSIELFQGRPNDDNFRRFKAEGIKVCIADLERFLAVKKKI